MAHDLYSLSINPVILTINLCGAYIEVSVYALFSTCLLYFFAADRPGLRQPAPNEKGFYTWSTWLIR